MKSIIIYKTNTGYSKQYAQMLKTRIAADFLISINKLRKKDLEGMDNIIFFGPIRSNKILGLRKFLHSYGKIKNKNIFIFGVGLMPNSDERKDMIIYTNKLHKYHVRLYLIPGGFDITRFSKFKQKMMGFVIKIASKAKPELNMIFSRSVNFVMEDNLDKMVDVFYKIN